MYDGGQRLRSSIQREGFSYLRTTVIERVKAEADKPTRQHDLVAENPDGVYAVSEDEEEDDFAIKCEKLTSVDARENTGIEVGRRVERGRMKA
jgi:hypothetical protein